MIKKIQIELVILALLMINILLSHNIDVGLYNYFSEVNYGQEAIYLKEFFIRITELGDSLWYFLIFILIFLFSFLGKGPNLIFKKKNSYLKNLSIYSLSYLLIVGLITQIIKHLVGRPRPNHADFDKGFGFDFFSTDSAFHSFPSGHSSTIIAVTLIFCIVIPRLSLFFYFFGFVVAISRVVVGAHFFTDVVGGALIAIIVFKIINFVFQKKYPSLYYKNFGLENISALNRSMVVFFLLALFLTIGFEFDIFFSGLFYYGNGQFFLQTYDLISILFRKILLPFLLIYIFIFPIFSKFFQIKKIFFNYQFSFKEVFFIWFSGTITLVFLVNVFLKDTWGRVRPNDILQFGGGDVFTPWYKLSDSCASNCSFVSGDAAAGFALVVFYFVTKKIIYCYLSLIFGLLLGFIRIIAGGHFLSDVVFSQLIVTFSIALLFYINKKYYDK